jgi:hypothetical protein
VVSSRSKDTCNRSNGKEVKICVCVSVCLSVRLSSFSDACCLRLQLFQLQLSHVCMCVYVCMNPEPSSRKPIMKMMLLTVSGKTTSQNKSQ